MMICGSCAMRMDGAAVLACKTRMYDIAEAGHAPVISPMGNLPIHKDLVVDMAPFWSKMRAMKPYLQPGYDEAPEGKEYLISPERLSFIHKEALCINCGACVSECNAMEADPLFLGPQALAKGYRFVGDPRDGATIERLEDYNGEHGIWECTRCYFCNERCPKGVDPRDAIAKLGAEAMKRRDRPGHGRQACEVVRDLGADDRLVARDRARPQDPGPRLGDQADEVRARPAQARQGAAAGAAARGRQGRAGPRAAQARPGAGSSRCRRDHPGRARARAARARDERRGAHGGWGSRDQADFVSEVPSTWRPD